MRKSSQVRKAYRKHMLAQICTMPEEKFGPAFGMDTVYLKRAPIDADYYHFRDNGARVLAVAHLDTVVARNQRTPAFYDTKKGPVIRSGALDDRLGAYVILGLLPKLGITTDVLLTVGEECAESTAEYFTPPRQYDWVIEFDRAGTDVVMYQYEDEPSARAVEMAGARMGWGSFSDIAYLEHLGVKAFNWGVGYRGNYHSQSGYAYLNDTFAMVAKYLRFHKQNAGVPMVHDPAPAHDSYVSTGGKWDECIACFALDSLTAAGYCQECGSCQDCGDDEAHCTCYTAQTLRDWRADADGTDSPDDAIAGARAAWEASPGTVWHAEVTGTARDVTGRAVVLDANGRALLGGTPTGTGWAGAESALGVAVTDLERRAHRMSDAVAAFRTMPDAGR